MKTIALFLALLVGALCQTAVTKTDLYMTGGPSNLVFDQVNITTALTFQMRGEAGEIITISPLPADERKLNSPPEITELWPRYHRPEKPEEITVRLWTKDGKKWVAKWEEVKP